MESLSCIPRNQNIFFAYSHTDEAASLLKTLTPEEKKRLSFFKQEKRKKEWLAGRLAARRAARKMLPGREVSVLNRESGVPYFPEAPDVYLSITHSAGHAAALVCDRPVGIDLEWVEERPESFETCFLTLEERAVLRTGDARAVDVTRCWTRKEAVAKLLGEGGRIPFKQINTVEDIIQYSDRKMELHSEVWKGYVISIALEDLNG